MGSWLLGKTGSMMMMLSSISSEIEGMKVGSIMVLDGMKVLSKKITFLYSRVLPLTLSF